MYGRSYDNAEKGAVIKMKSAIERIIDNDRKARECVAAAERHRGESADALAQKRAQIETEIEAEIAESAKNARERSEKKSDEIIASHRKDAEDISRRMEELYQSKKSEWIETYTSRVTEGE